jgi:hypothetical protein
VVFLEVVVVAVVEVVVVVLVMVVVVVVEVVVVIVDVVVVIEVVVVVVADVGMIYCDEQFAEKNPGLQIQNPSDVQFPLFKHSLLLVHKNIFSFFLKKKQKNF